MTPLLEFYCYDCHGDGMAKGGLSMDEFENLDAHLDDQDHWLAVWRNVRSQVMPPSDEFQFKDSEKDELLTWIERKIFQLDLENPDPGRVTIRRLNRTEYQYAVKDLLGIDFAAEDHFPPDDSGYGFDNNGDVLSISPLLMEKYISAAAEVVQRALPVNAAARIPRQDYAGEHFTRSGKDSGTTRWMPFKKKAITRGAINLKRAGDYQITVEYTIRGALEASTQEARLVMRAGGKKIGTRTLGWDQSKILRLSGKTNLEKGRQTLALSLKPRQKPVGDEEELSLAVSRVILKGPLGGGQREATKAYREIFVDGPAPEDDAGKAAYARKILHSFVSRAFRRPVDAGTVKRLVKIVGEDDRRPGKKFADGIRAALTTCLCSPRFLFRAEIQAEPNNPEKIIPLDEYALASRLSFFLWSSVPDDELLSLAYQKKLRANLPAQIERMLADPRSARLVENFVGQWLRLRDLDTLPIQAKEILGLDSRRAASRAFDVRLRDDMRRETEMLFDYILKKNRSAEELISARYTFLNERLADFYGIKNVHEEDFRLVDLTEYPNRGGILTQGSFLIVTSNPTRTSPVKRGLFVLNNLLGTPAPPTPPNVPDLGDSGKITENMTMREQMEIHREKPECASCHARMDPIGLGLEHFDALGRYRALENGNEIDSAGVLLTGEKFSSVAGLKKVLAGKRREDFYRCLAEKLLTYAIGRGVEFYDAPTIDKLVERLQKNDGQLKELVVGIIESAPFQKRRGEK